VGPTASLDTAENIEMFCLVIGTFRVFITSNGKALSFTCGN
jgi:hypothetical protein